MKLQKYLVILPLAFASLTTVAETKPNESASVFHFSTQVNRTIEKDLMEAEVYSRKAGKNLAELTKSVSTHLNGVLEEAKRHTNVELAAQGVNHSADYDKKGKVIGWMAEGSISLKSKDFDAMAKILENLGEHVAIRTIHFSVSPEKMASLEDEMTLEIIKQFQHKANVIQQELNAKKYTLSDIQLSTPNGANNQTMPRMYSMTKMASMSKDMDELPMEAGKQTISASASGKVIFE